MVEPPNTFLQLSIREPSQTNQSHYICLYIYLKLDIGINKKEKIYLKLYRGEGSMENIKMEERRSKKEGDGVVLIHSQVKKIKQEDEKIKKQLHPWVKPETRPAYRDLSRQVSRSRLGLASGRPIYVGH